MPATLDLDKLTSAHVLYWYCRVWRSWGVAYHLANGDQVGEAEWYYHKSDAMAAAERLAAARRCPIGKLAAV